MDDERTSPIAKMPGTLVWNVRHLEESEDSGTFVKTKPLSSSSTSLPRSHWVFGSAPVNRNRCLVLIDAFRPLACTVILQSPSPSQDADSIVVRVCIVTLLSAITRSIRYRDMLSSSPPRLTSTWTWLA